jgi:hypothetical protein
MPGLYNLDKLAKALDCSVDDFRYWWKFYISTREINILLYENKTLFLKENLLWKNLYSLKHLITKMS